MRLSKVKAEIEVEEKDPRLDEHWVMFEGFEKYSVSNYGRVMVTRTGHELKQTVDKDGHLRVYLHYQGKRYRVYVRLLVASAFFLNYKSGVGVGFLNGNKQDCSVLNLTLMKAVRR